VQSLINKSYIDQSPGTRTCTHKHTYKHTHTHTNTHTVSPETGLVTGTSVVGVGTGVVAVGVGLRVAVGGVGTPISVELRVHAVPIAKALRSHKLAHALSSQGCR